MYKAQSIVNLLLGGLTSVKHDKNSFKLQTQGNISQRQWSDSPLNNHKLLKTEWTKWPLGYDLGKFRRRKAEIRQTSPLAKVVSEEQQTDCGSS